MAKRAHRSPEPPADRAPQGGHAPGPGVDGGAAAGAAQVDEQPPAAAQEVPEAGAGEAGPGTAQESVPGELEQLRAELEAERARADDNWERLLRAQAEMDNLRKRSERDVENAHKYALEGFVGELLAVRDSLELGLQAAGEGDGELAKIREGTELTLKILVQVMDKYNVRPVDPLGERFDPALHQAMTMQESREAEPNTVIGVIQKGYTLNDRLMRPALVSVAK